MYIQISDNVRIDRGPMRKYGKATPELLDNRVTADHYFVGGKDAYGYEIKAYEQFCYLDWKGEWVWYIYEWRDGRYQPIDVQNTEHEARIVANELEVST